jgi:hypothetical protein
MLSFCVLNVPCGMVGNAGIVDTVP